MSPITACDQHTSDPYVASLRRRIRGLEQQVINAYSATAHRLALPPGLSINDERWQASIGDQVLDLAEKEYTLLACLAHDPGRVWERRELLHAIWPDAAPDEVSSRTRTLDSHAVRLRTKMREADPSRNWIEAVRSIGYVLVRQPIGVVVADERRAAIAALHTIAAGRELVGVEGDRDGTLRLALAGGVSVSIRPDGSVSVGTGLRVAA